MSQCPCGSGDEYASCCEPYIQGSDMPATAELLMRSRYTAYTRGEIEYLHTTLHPDHRDDHDIEAARKWASESEWLDLEICRTEAGGKNDDTGVVEFIARYREKGKPHQLHEISRFQKIDGQWFYVDGEMPKPATVRHEGKKTGRNEPCPCGSGKKYKKCCGK